MQLASPQPTHFAVRFPWRYLLLLGCGFAVGIALPIVPDSEFMSILSNSHRRVDAAQAPATVRTRPQLSCDPTASAAGGMDGLQQKVEGILRDAKVHGVVRAAVRVVDLSSCEQFTLGAEERFIAGSLLKLPIAVAWVRGSGTSELGLDRPLLYDHPPAVTEAPVDPDPLVLEVGQSYPIRQLLKHLLVDSSNNALIVLSAHVPRQEFAEIWAELGVGPAPQDQDPTSRVGASAD